MRPTEAAIQKLPAHLRRYVVTQDYDAYTSRDQAVWRHILHRLKAHLGDKAHSVYLEGLEATGIGSDAQVMRGNVRIGQRQIVVQRAADRQRPGGDAVHLPHVAVAVEQFERGQSAAQFHA